MNKIDIISLIAIIIFVGLLVTSLIEIIKNDNLCNKKCDNLDAITNERIYSHKYDSYVCVCQFEDSIKIIGEMEE